MGRWDQAVNKSGNGLYMDLQPGKNMFRVLSDPVVQNKEFDNGPTTIFSWLVWDYATSSVRILSKGSSFLKKFDFFMDAWGDDIPMKCDIIVQKEGTGLNTRYEFAAMPIRNEMAADWKQQMARIDMSKAVPNSFSIKDYIERDHGPQYDVAGFQVAYNASELAESNAADELKTRALGPKEDEPPFTDQDAPVDVSEIPF